MSHGSGEEENYWPGYVDALTSMVQVLAFVMMLLAMAVFVLSQNVSRNAVEAIAKAAHVETPPDATTEALTAAVIAHVVKLQLAPAPPPDAAPAASAGGADAGDAKGSPGGAAKDGGAPATEAAKPAAGVDAGDAKGSLGGETADAGAPKTGAAETPKPAAGRDAGDAKGSPGGRTEDKGSAAAAAKIEGDSVAEGSELSVAHAASPTISHAAPTKAPPPSDQAITIRFAARSSHVPPEAIPAIEKLLADKRALEDGRLVTVTSYASAAAGALTEARRLAYYRSVMLRKALSDRKVALTRVRVLLVDTQDAAQGDTATVLVGEPVK